jgi:hypothetical protein
MDNRVAFADGRKEIEADELTFNKVDRHHGGIYECVADNGYGKVSLLILFIVGYARKILIFKY